MFQIHIAEKNYQGGFIETSGHVLNLLATINAGRGGMWLLDPIDITISNASQTPTWSNSYSPSGSATVNVTNINSALSAGSNVTIVGDNITISLVGNNNLIISKSL